VETTTGLPLGEALLLRVGLFEVDGPALGELETVTGFALGDALEPGVGLELTVGEEDPDGP